MTDGKLEGSYNTRVDSEPEVAMAGLKQDLGCLGWQHHWNHGWSLTGSGNGTAGSIMAGP